MKRKEVIALVKTMLVVHERDKKKALKKGVIEFFGYVGMITILFGALCLFVWVLKNLPVVDV